METTWTKEFAWLSFVSSFGCFSSMWKSRSLSRFLLLFLHYSYSKRVARTPLSLRPITVLPVPYRLYASLRCQSLLCWQNTWIHSSQFAFCKGRSTTSLNSHLSFDLLSRYQTHGCFAGLQFDFAKCFDSIPYSVIWTALRHYGCDSALVDLCPICTPNISRCFRYAGCLGSFWFATNGLLQGDPLSVIILNCVLCPLVTRLSSFMGLTVYAFADDLTVVSSSWDTLSLAYDLLIQFSSSSDLCLNLGKCQLWNKGNPFGNYPACFDQFMFCFYPFCLVRLLILGFLMMPPFPLLTRLSFFVHSVLLSCPFRMLCPTVFLLP